MPFEVVLVDDHKLVRDGVRTILERGAEFHVVGEAETGADAVHLCRKSQPDIVLMDISLPGMNGIETTNELLRHCPGIKVIILSMFDDENSVVSAIRSGARAFVLNYRIAGRERRYTIGLIPAWKAAEARNEAKRLTRLIDQGRDPDGRAS